LFSLTQTSPQLSNFWKQTIVTPGNFLCYSVAWPKSALGHLAPESSSAPFSYESLSPAWQPQQIIQSLFLYYRKYRNFICLFFFFKFSSTITFLLIHPTVFIVYLLDGSPCDRWWNVIVLKISKSYQTTYSHHPNHPNKHAMAQALGVRIGKWNKSTVPALKALWYFVQGPNKEIRM
jgi:hypothetical protein